ncbi:peptidoglycan-binding domain-containing protein [Streptomyces yokosukanensis]|nr:peptidoglycan-binding domain-containing protein [Streptomyces yokosukanensis]
MRVAAVSAVAAISVGLLATPALAQSDTGAHPAGTPYNCYYTAAEPQLSIGDGHGPNASDTTTLAVKEAQCELNSVMNRHVTVDGWFGSGTRRAVVDFQHYCAGITDDGIIGPNTWSKLDYWWGNGKDCRY